MMKISNQMQRHILELVSDNENAEGGGEVNNVTSHRYRKSIPLQGSVSE